MAFISGTVVKKKIFPKDMPLYRKALNLKEGDLDRMTFDELYELLLCFRYLRFRNDTTLSAETMDRWMEEIRKRMLEINSSSANYQNFL